MMWCEIDDSAIIDRRKTFGEALTWTFKKGGRRRRERVRASKGDRIKGCFGWKGLPIYPPPLEL